jgi:stalled ribosome alternative rescue factor ArfA
MLSSYIFHKEFEKTKNGKGKKWQRERKSNGRFCLNHPSCAVLGASFALL